MELAKRPISKFIKPPYASYTTWVLMGYRQCPESDLTQQHANKRSPWSEGKSVVRPIPPDLATLTTNLPPVRPHLTFHTQSCRWRHRCRTGCRILSDDQIKFSPSGESCNLASRPRPRHRRLYPRDLHPMLAVPFERLNEGFGGFVDFVVWRGVEDMGLGLLCKCRKERAGWWVELGALQSLG